MRRAILALLLALSACGPARETGAPPAPFRPTAIVLHSTSGLDFHAALAAMARTGRGVHILIDADGNAHEVADPDRPTRAARGLDPVALHVSVVDPRQVEAAARVVGRLADRFRIPRSNADVISRRGIFSHQQAKYRFGGLKRGEERGRMEPGEDFMKALLVRIGGTFHEEKDWVDRAADGWICVWEGGNLGRRGDLTKGRGLTPAPPPPPPPIESAEERRMRYVDRGRMEDVRGVVLHFTATPTWELAVASFERRRLGPSILVDTEGRAWQVVDRLEDKVAAAAGTNDHCLQIEIVGENEAALLGNERQLGTVASVLRTLGSTRSIPLTNRDIDSLRGVFSHGQAKKRWGRSAWMWGEDFDPGEAYMKRVLEAAGGSYVPESDWTGRKSEAWAVIDEPWLP